MLMSVGRHCKIQLGDYCSALESSLKVNCYIHAQRHGFPTRHELLDLSKPPSFSDRATYSQREEKNLCEVEQPLKESQHDSEQHGDLLTRTLVCVFRVPSVLAPGYALDTILFSSSTTTCDE
jgi:hypothetical protein